MATTRESGSAHVPRLRRWLFADAPTEIINQRLRICLPLGLVVGLTFGVAIGGSKFPAPIYSGVVLGLIMGVVWGVLFPSRLIKRHRSEAVRIANGRDVDIWALRRERRTQLKLSPESALDLSRRAIGRLGGKVLSSDSEGPEIRASAAFPDGVTLDIAISSLDAGSRILMVTQPKRRWRLDDGATLRALDMMESVLRNGTQAPLPR
jgi:hypothetical protein